MVDLGLLQSSDLFGLQNLSTEHVEYGYLYNEFYPVARTAFSNFQLNKSILESKYGNFEDFKNKFSWLKTLCLFSGVKICETIMNHGGHGIKYKNLVNFDKILVDHLDEVSFHFFYSIYFLDNGLR